MKMCLGLRIAVGVVGEGEIHSRPQPIQLSVHD